MTKVKKLSFVFIGLLLVSLVLTWAGKEERFVSVDKNLFSIADTTQIIGLSIEKGGPNDIHILRSSEAWTINGKYKADPQLIYLMQRILGAVQTQRRVSRSQYESIRQELKEGGYLVTVKMGGGANKKFFAGGNEAKTRAYFGNEDLSKIYTVAIPGYKSYLSGIFELSLNQWRDRVLFASSWRTIQNLVVDYTDPNLNDLKILFKDQFLTVDGVTVMDTTTLMSYLQPFEFFQLNDYLNPGSFPSYDSLLGVIPVAKLTLSDINSKNNRQLSIFPKISGERFYLVTGQANEMMVVDEGRMQKLLAQPNQFQKE